MGRRNFSDRHHVLRDRVSWEARLCSRTLRETPELVPRIHRETHDQLHRECPPVPLIGHHALTRTVNTFVPVPGSTIGTMDRLMFAIERSTRHPKAHKIEKELAQLAIQAIDLQREYIPRKAVA